MVFNLIRQKGVFNVLYKVEYENGTEKKFITKCHSEFIDLGISIDKFYNSTSTEGVLNELKLSTVDSVGYYINM